MLGIETHNMEDTYYTKSDDVQRAAFRKWLKDMLHIGPVKVYFLKKDGTVRNMNCTLEESVVVPHEKTTDRVKEQNDEVCPVWDLEKKAWRSFRYDTIMKIELEIAVD